MKDGRFIARLELGLNEMEGRLLGVGISDLVAALNIQKDEEFPAGLSDSGFLPGWLQFLLARSGLSEPVDFEFGDRLELFVIIKNKIVFAEIRHRPPVTVQDPDRHELDHCGGVMARDPWRFLPRPLLGWETRRRAAENGGREKNPNSPTADLEGPANLHFLPLLWMICCSRSSMFHLHIYGEESIIVIRNSGFQNLEFLALDTNHTSISFGSRAKKT
jgi:hypothetical protein